MEKIGTRGALLIEPALRPSVLAVPALSFLREAASIVVDTVLIVGIDVTNLPVAVTVGICKSIKEPAIANGIVPLNDVMQRHLQFLSCLARGVIVVAIGNLCGEDSTKREKQEA